MPGERVGGRKGFSGVSAEVGAAPHPRRPAHSPTLMSLLFPNYLCDLHEGSPLQFPKCLPECWLIQFSKQLAGLCSPGPSPWVTEAGVTH